MMKYNTKRVKINTGQTIEVVNYADLLAVDADVYIIFGMRTYGKSYGVLQYAIDNWLTKGEEFVSMRTIEDDVLQGKAKKYIATIKPYFDEMTKYEKEMTVYNSEIIARSVDTDAKMIRREKIGSMMSLSGWLKYKGNNYDKVTTIIFEEFLERVPKLTSEAFMEGYLNNLSTVIRLRDNVKIFCLANTVRKKSPIFDYYGIRVEKLRKGKPILFKAENGLKICVFWTPDPKLEKDYVKHYTVTQTKESEMITSGSWEENDYKVSYNGATWYQIANTRTYRRSATLRLKDIGIEITYPDFNFRMPLLIHGFTDKSKVTESDLHSFFVYMPSIAAYTRKMIITKNVVTDGKVNDKIDLIKDIII